MSDINEVRGKQIIPADQWPDDAHLHTWEPETGYGYWTVQDAEEGYWTIRKSCIPMPRGWDWRVPVMRPTVKDSLPVAPAIDLELVREAVEVAIAHAGPNDGSLAGWQRLQGLIDGQPNDNGVRVDRGALQMALNVLRRAGKDEVADELAGGVIDGQAVPRQLAEWHEDFGSVTWWAWRGSDWAGEPAWCGTPNDSDWPGYHTHWTPHPAMPMRPTKGEGVADVP